MWRHTPRGNWGGMGHFIPWDDDLDLCISEDFYDEAIDVLIAEIKENDGMIVQCPQTDFKYYLGWAKVRDKNSHVYPDAPCFKENGVWIDIYKLSKVNRKDVPVLIARENIDYLDRRLNAGGLTKDEYGMRMANGQLQEKLEEAKERSYLSNDDSKVYLIRSASKVTLEEGWVEPLSHVTFEGLNVTTFAQPKKYLEQHYGKYYDTFPPDEERRVGLTRIEVF